MTQKITDLATLRRTIESWRAAGETIAFIPTMGALHAGHLALVEEGKKHATRTVVSIFVNPTQFGPNEDFNRYPRTLDADLAALASAGADAAWVPDVATMYPDGPKSTLHFCGTLTETLEGAIRPGHFDGVATIVARLFEQVTPDFAIFGEKDYQQLLLIKRLVKELDLKIKIIGLPTLRESDGLALSSRNRYLSPEERKKAVKLNQVLRHTVFAIRDGREQGAVEKAVQLLLDGGFDKVDYIALRDAETLEPATKPPARLLAAAWLGNTRLIDNFPV